MGQSRDRSGPDRYLLPILGGTVLFLLHLALMAAGASASPLGNAARWATGVGGLALLLIGAALLPRRLGKERRIARDAAVARAQIQGLVDASPLAIIAGDRQGRVILWSQAAEQILGWRADEVVGARYPAVPPEQEEEWQAARRRVLAGETIRDVETRRYTRDGRLIDVSLSAAPVRDRGGEITGTIAVISDLSMSRDAEREVHELENQLRQAQKLEVVGRLAAGIAHDFNNLLTAIQGNAELILAAADTPANIEEDLREISRSAARAAALTRQLLTFTHRAKARKTPLEVNAMVQGMETLLHRLLGETIALKVELSPDTGDVLMDPNQMEQVLMNLVVNARDALSDDGEILIRTQGVEVDQAEAETLPYEVRPGPYGLITVSDNGAGMDADTMERIFEPFFTTKPVGVGTGLGLSTVYSIVKQARGHIRVDSEPGAGTTFRIYLPSHEGERPAASTEERGVETGVTGSGTILVVEDEEAVLSMARRTLQRQGYDVLAALSGREAVSLALEHPGEIQILFCDMVMPDLTGPEVARRVRQARPEIQVLMTSGYGERRLAEEGALNGAAFLPKPYTPVDLTTRIRRLLARTTAP